MNCLESCPLLFDTFGQVAEREQGKEAVTPIVEKTTPSQWVPSMVEASLHVVLYM